MDKLDVGEDGAHPSAHLTELRARNKQLKIDLSSLRAELKAAGESCVQSSDARDSRSASSDLLLAGVGQRFGLPWQSSGQPGESTALLVAMSQLSADTLWPAVGSRLDRCAMWQSSDLQALANQRHPFAPTLASI
jgi:hypothetical protein